MFGMSTKEAAPTRKRLRKRWIIRLSIVFICIGTLYFLYWLSISRFYETTDDAYVGGNLIQVMPQISGQVTAILADETDLVKKGQPLVTLDKADAQVALKNTEDQLALTVRQVSQLYKKIDQLRANVTLAQASYNKAKEDYLRRQGLVLNKTISAEDLSHAKIAAASAQAALAAAKNQLSQAITIIQNADLYHHPQVLQAADKLRDAYLRWERTTIFAPETGAIAKRIVQLGQEINPGTVLMIIVPLNQLWVNANFKESQLKYIRTGQSVKLISDLYGSAVNFRGTVIGLNPGTGSTFELLPPENATGNWIKIVQRLPVRISIDPDQLAKYPLQIGLSMVVTVDTHNRTGKILSKLPTNRIVYQTENYGSQLKQADVIINKILIDNSPNLQYIPIGIEN